MKSLPLLKIGKHIRVDGMRLRIRDMASYLYVYKDCGLDGFPPREEASVNRWFMTDESGKWYCLDVPENADSNLFAFYEVDKRKKIWKPGKRVPFKIIT